MAKADHVFDVSGKLGPVVYYKRYGKIFVRTAPQLKPRKRRKYTEKQTQAKSKFAIANRFVRYLNPLWRETYQEFKESGSPYHKAVGQMNLYAISGNTPEDVVIHYDKAPMALGTQVPLSITSQQVMGNELHIEWETTMGDPKDTVSFIPIHKTPTNKMYEVGYSSIFHTPIVRSIGKASFDFSSFLIPNYALYVYVYFRNEEKKRNSNSTFVCVIPGKPLGTLP